MFGGRPPIIAVLCLLDAQSVGSKRHVGAEHGFLDPAFAEAGDIDEAGNHRTVGKYDGFVVRIGEPDANDAPIGKRLQFAGIDLAVGIGVLPYLEIRPDCSSCGQQTFGDETVARGKHRVGGVSPLRSK